MPFKSNWKGSSEGSEAGEGIGLTDKTMIIFDNSIMYQCKWHTLSTAQSDTFRESLTS